MKRTIAIAVVLPLIVGLVSSVTYGQKEDRKGKAYYKPKYRDPVLEEIKDNREAERKAADQVTSEIREAQEVRDEDARGKDRILTFDFEDINVPGSPDIFKAPFHFPPTPQYYTGTCWCFATTSFFESEVFRLTGQKIKISEMYTVYYEYLEKVARWVRERGDSDVEEGSETNAVPRIWKKYGAVPREVYEGVLAEDGRFDHEPMMDEIHAFLDFVAGQDLWDEDYVVAGVRLILDRYMGEPPTEVRWKGRPYTPKEYLANVLKINPDDYVHVISTLRFPFYEKGEYEVPDNWWHSEEWYNFPLDVWYDVLKRAAKAGYTVAIGGDTSEPGYQGFEDAAVVPGFDIPSKYIDQDSREFRFYNKTSFDDHAIHLLGFTKFGGREWFLIKDSARSSRWGKHEGYYFYREDYVRLKVLSYTVHKDMIQHLRDKIGG
jgi:bleomycin hydrolase